MFHSKLLLMSAFMVTTSGFLFGRNLRNLRCTTRSLGKLEEASTIGYDVEAWKKGFKSCIEEICVVTNNSIPLDLCGTFFRNGPGLYEIGKDQILHPFDADGMIFAATFKEGTAVLRNRIIQTKGYVKEKKARKLLLRPSFSLLSGGFLRNIFNIKIKNTANTNIIYWADRLLALSEAGLPYRIEPDSLRTIGDYTFQGLLNVVDE